MKLEAIERELGELTPAELRTLLDVVRGRLSQNHSDFYFEIEGFERDDGARGYRVVQRKKSEAIVELLRDNELLFDSTIESQPADGGGPDVR